MKNPTKEVSTPDSEPTRFVDETCTRATDEWLAWEERQRFALSENGWLEVAASGYEPSMYFPEKEGKSIPDEGAWILILEEPDTPMKQQFRLPELSMWRARRHQLDYGQTLSNGSVVYPQQAVISTPAGALHLWPHEYVIANDPLGLAADSESELHSLGGEPVIDQEQMFFLQSRGISHNDAALMLFDTISSLDFVYVTFPDWVTDALRGAGRSLRRHIALSESRT
jgi:hypothetical protein